MTRFCRTSDLILQLSLTSDLITSHSSVIVIKIFRYFNLLCLSVSNMSQTDNTHTYTYTYTHTALTIHWLHNECILTLPRLYIDCTNKSVTVQWLQIYITLTVHSLQIDATVTEHWLEIGTTKTVYCLQVDTTVTVHLSLNIKLTVYWLYVESVINISFTVQSSWMDCTTAGSSQ